MTSLTENVVRDVEAVRSKYDKSNDLQFDWNQIVELLKANGSKDPEFVAFSIFISLEMDFDERITLSQVKAHSMDIYANKCEKIIKKDINVIIKDHADDKFLTWENIENVFGRDKECSNPETFTYFLFRCLKKENDEKVTIDELKSYSKKINNLGPSQ